MKRLATLAVLAMASILIAGSSLSYAQGVFSIPFRFKAGGKAYAAGDYSVAPKGDGQVALRKAPGGEEVLISFTERLAQPETPITEPQLVFDVVGNFEPSYTEYVTEYVLAEFWLPGEQGYLIHITKGAHQNKTIKGQPLKIKAQH
jgi:hypothetical protein